MTDKDGSNGLAALLGGFGESRFSPEQEACNALRRENARKSDLAYNYAMQEVGNNLEYASSSHIFAGFFGLVSDATTTLLETGRQFMNSPFIMKELRLNPSGDVTTPELIKTLLREEAMKKGRLNNPELEKSLESIDYLEKYVQYPTNIANYAAKQGISCDAVLADAESQYEVIKQTWGSVDAYDSLRRFAEKDSKERMQQLQNLGKLPLEMLIPLFVSTKLGVHDLSEFGVDIRTISSLAKSYLNDFSLFGSAFIKSLTEQRIEEIEDLRFYEKKSQQ